MRTTSALEAFNSVLSRSLPKHANFFKFIDSIKHHEFSRFTDFLNSIDQTSEPVKKKRKQDQLRDEKIKHCSERLKEGQINFKEFLSTVSGLEDLPFVLFENDVEISSE